MSERQIIQDKQKEVEKVSVLKGVICSCAGSHTAPIYKKVFDKDLNRMVVKQTGETDIYEFIQASKCSTDLATLQQRFIALGEIPAIDPSMGENDLSIFPDNIHEVYKMANDVDGAYSKLPDSVKTIFGSSQAYMSALLDGSYLNKINEALSKKVDVPADTQPKEGE